MDAHFFRCITCQNYEPGSESCGIHNLIIKPELNLCSFHSSLVYKHVDKNVIYIVEETLLGTTLIKDKKVVNKKEKYFFCVNCRKKVAKKLEKENFNDEIYISLLKTFFEAKPDLVEAVFNSVLCEKEEFQKILNEPEIVEFNFPKISLCGKCKIKVKTFKEINKDNNIESKISYLLEKIVGD